jgi:hypothetical protein
MRISRQFVSSPNRARFGSTSSRFLIAHHDSARAAGEQQDDE